MFIRDFGIENQFLSIIVQHLYCVFEFNAVEPLTVNNFPDLCDELAGTFESCYFYSYMCEIRLLCTCEGFRNET